MRGSTSMFLAGAAWGAGISLFSLYLLSGAFPMTLAGWPRLAVAVIGLALWITGLLAGRRLSPRGEPGARDAVGARPAGAADDIPA